MLSKRVLRQKTASISAQTLLSRRWLQHDGRNRLSNIWVPSQRAPDDTQSESGHDLLVRAGFLRQAHSGIFHLLPLGLRVQEKVERLIDKHMQSIGASKVSLSSISSEDLWQRSGRLDQGRTSELLHLEDRRGTKYLLSPTHEEEITTIIANAVHSYKELPLRLYQVSRKYRDELRPRQGLLRGREFVMKDLYTFDVDTQEAHATYDEVRRAYSAFMDELKMPYLTARADSGNMGGKLSHEFHFASEQGEDTIISCDKCKFSVNEELFIGPYDPRQAPLPWESQNAEADVEKEVAIEYYISKDRNTLCTIYFPAEQVEPNIHAVKAIFPYIDTGITGEQARAAYEETTGGQGQAISFQDPRLSLRNFRSSTNSELVASIRNAPLSRYHGQVILLTKAQQGDTCAKCQEGKLNLQQAVEIGHTFHLGQRYSEPLNAKVLNKMNLKVPIEMGCHGIGVSRLIGAVASLLADQKGLNWPLEISPFEVIIVPSSEVTPDDVNRMYDLLTKKRGGLRTLDVAIDDRDRGLGWKLRDADLVGYPFIVVMGNQWRKREAVELQCRRRGTKMNVAVSVSAEELIGRIRELCEQL
ncbi:uncharacterized protein LTR77_006535 [Saxophila tyrrhenica]|uniref:proline--tRNA ligase n=1 Tax=Saxophila tyrrhenica TaxID=1690608 RepID=A0AAV9P818_9PEZI|nr:hypothetical protein LTR77_006535 [Saxophila tyrrhenica]